MDIRENMLSSKVIRHETLKGNGYIFRRCKSAKNVCLPSEKGFALKERICSQDKCKWI